MIDQGQSGVELSGVGLVWAMKNESEECQYANVDFDLWTFVRNTKQYQPYKQMTYLFSCYNPFYKDVPTYEKLDIFMPTCYLHTYNMFEGIENSKKIKRN